ncbi:MAG: GNAT family N-acetyltransferase [Paracoccaceae bacterium]
MAAPERRFAGEAPLARLLSAMDATWPAAETQIVAGWVLRRGAGGGQRVSAASAHCPGEVPEIAAAVSGLAAFGQPPLFRVGGDERALDAALDRAGFLRNDPVLLYKAAIAELDDGADETARLIRVTAPVRIVEEIWDAGGIGPGRRAVMARVCGPKATLLARIGDRPAGVAFVAVDEDVAMIHAIEVVPAARRQGAGARLLRGAAAWAREAGASTLALAVTEANRPATALYDRLGMAVLGRYHYRIAGGA